MKPFLIFLFFVFGNCPGFACRCAYHGFPEAYLYSSQIFTGTVIKKTERDYHNYWLFAVKKIYKGSLGDTITLQSGIGGGDCGSYFDPGRTYLIYATNHSTDRCTRNALSDSTADIAFLEHLYNRDFTLDIGQSDEPLLTPSEGFYMNQVFSNIRDSFDFSNKKLAYFYSGELQGKQAYFKENGDIGYPPEIMVLSPDQKNQAGYDAVLVYWGSLSPTKNRRKILYDMLLKNRRG